MQSTRGCGMRARRNWSRVCHVSELGERSKAGAGARERERERKTGEGKEEKNSWLRAGSSLLHTHGHADRHCGPRYNGLLFRSTADILGGESRELRQVGDVFDIQCSSCFPFSSRLTPVRQTDGRPAVRSLARSGAGNRRYNAEIKGHASCRSRSRAR